jgi:hypothetical protein
MQGKPAVAIIGAAFLQGASSNLTNRLTNASVRNAAELILRRNGIPVAAICEGGTVNCAKLNVQILANCVKTNLLPSGDCFCPLQVRVQYLENVDSIRPGADPSGEALSYREFCVTWEYPLLFPVATTENYLRRRPGILD